VSVYRLAPGIRLRPGECGTAMLLIPEGVVKLSDTACATLACVDGASDERTIAERLAREYEAPEETMLADVRELLETFAARGYLLTTA